MAALRIDGFLATVITRTSSLNHNRKLKRISIMLQVRLVCPVESGSGRICLISSRRSPPGFDEFVEKVLCGNALMVLADLGTRFGKFTFKWFDEVR